MQSTKKVTTRKKKIQKPTFSQMEGNAEFPAFAKDRDRLKYMKKMYKEMDIESAFRTYYEEKTPKTKKQKQVAPIESFVTLEVGKIVTATVTRFERDGLEFEIPGVKDEIISKENLTEYKEAIEQYMMTHDGKLSIEVREFRHGRWIVSVLNAYYRIWQEAIDEAIKTSNAIQVTLTELTKGGYIGTTDIWTLQELTGRDFVSTIFLPGSQIVLNIERNFEQWVGKTVIVVPQKFGKFRKAQGLPIEDSIICSRKRALQIAGITNLYNLYNKHMLVEKLQTTETTEEKTYVAKVTGIINSNNKTGIFLELDELFITGLMNTTPDELINYVPGQKLTVKIKEFDVIDGKEPFLIKDNKIKKCYVRPIFVLA